MNELNDRNLSNLEFIKNYDPKKGVGLSSGKLTVSDIKNDSVEGVLKGVLKSVNDSLTYNIELCHKKIMDLSTEEESSQVNTEDGEGQVENTSDKIKDLLLLIDESKKIKNGLDNLISESEKSNHSQEEVEKLKTIANAHIEEFSQLLNKEPLSLKVAGNRTDGTLEVAVKTLIKLDYKEELKKAVDHGSKEEIQNLISKGANINVIFDDGTNPLTLSLFHGNDNLAHFLISAGADLNGHDANGDVPFLLAIETGNSAMVTSFLNNPNVDVNVQNHMEQGHTPLIMGSHEGDESLVQGLLDRNVEINKLNNANQSGAFVAAAEGHDKILSLLIRNGADLTIQDKTGVSPLIASVYGDHLECVRLILNNGIKPDVAVATGGNTALHVAAYRGSLNIIEALIEAGADPFKVNDLGETPFEISVKAGDSSCCKAMLKNINFKNLTEDQKSELMFFTASEGLDSQLEDLIALFPDVNIPSKNGETLLMAAISKVQISTVALLLEKGAKASGVFDGLSHDPFIKAAFAGSVSIIEKLLKHGADSSYRDSNGFTALEYFLLLRPYAVNDVFFNFPLPAIDQEFQHFNILQKTPEGLENYDSGMDELVVKLKIAKKTNLHRRLETPIDESTKISADNLYALLHQSTFDVEQLGLDNVEAHTRLQSARMSGSTTITRSTSSIDQKLAATDEWKTAEELVRFWLLTQEPLTAEKLCELNSILNPKNRTGKYRSVGVAAGGRSLNSYVPGDEVATEVGECLSWLTDRLAACDSGKENPIIVAALAYQRLVSIHPFSDGNGRTCRLVMDYVLQRFGLPPSCPNDVNVAIFGFFTSDITPSKAVMKIVSGLETSVNIFKGLA